MAFRDLFKRRRTKDEGQINVPNLEHEVKRVRDIQEDKSEAVNSTVAENNVKTSNKQKISGPRIIFQTKSPSCNIHAIVEENDECVYFELIGQDQSGPFMKSCWVRNYKKAPREMQPRIKENGESSMLAGMYCVEPEGSPKIYPSNLEVVWTEEGDGAALLYNGEILSVILNDVYDQCPGYARDCTAPTTFAWPLGKDDVKVNPIIKRIRKAQEFWENWDDNTWSDAADEYLKYIEENLGAQKEIYSIDGGKWPPKVMSLIEKGDTTYIFTVGVSLRPQPQVQKYFSNSSDFKRFELAFAIKSELLEKNKENILQYLSNVTCLPWVNIGWISNGHTMRCDVLNDNEIKFSNVLFINNMFIENAPDLKFRNYRGDRVNILWLIPLTEEEEELCEKTGAGELLENIKDSNENLMVFTAQPKFDVDSIKASIAKEEEAKSEAVDKEAGDSAKEEVAVSAEKDVLNKEN